MKVKELIEILEEQDPEAEVLIMSQPNWPFEYSVYGVATREEIAGDEDLDEQQAQEGAPSDVFLVEGTQLRYGSKAAWAVAYRG